MFQDNPTGRQRITQNLRDEIVNLRTRKDFSANRLATEFLKKPQSWLAQIETGRTKTISNSDLIKLFSALLSSNSDETEIYLSKNYDRLFCEDPINEEADSFKNSKVSYFKTDSHLSIEEKLRKQYLNQIDNIGNGLLFFFDHIKEKEDAVEILDVVLNNLQSDMGFTLSIASLPIYEMDEVDTSIKKNVFLKMADLIKENREIQETTDSTEKSEVNEK